MNKELDARLKHHAEDLMRALQSDSPELRHYIETKLDLIFLMGRIDELNQARKAMAEWSKEHEND